MHVCVWWGGMCGCMCVCVCTCAVCVHVVLSCGHVHLVPKSDIVLLSSGIMLDLAVCGEAIPKWFQPNQTTNLLFPPWTA